METTNGFNSPLEYVDSFGNIGKPSIVYIQIGGRRESMNQLNLTKMQQNNKERGSKMWRWMATYDFLIDGFPVFISN